MGWLTDPLVDLSLTDLQHLQQMPYCYSYFRLTRFLLETQEGKDVSTPQTSTAFQVQVTHGHMDLREIGITMTLPTAMIIILIQDVIHSVDLVVLMESQDLVISPDHHCPIMTPGHRGTPQLISSDPLPPNKSHIGGRVFHPGTKACNIHMTTGDLSIEMVHTVQHIACKSTVIILSEVQITCHLTCLDLFGRKDIVLTRITHELVGVMTVTGRKHSLPGEALLRLRPLETAPSNEGPPTGILAGQANFLFDRIHQAAAVVTTVVAEEGHQVTRKRILSRGNRAIGRQQPPLRGDRWESD